MIRLWSVCPLTNLLWFLYQTVECGSSILSEWFFISRVLSLPWPTVTGLHRSLDRLRPALLSHWTDCTWLCYGLLYWDEDRLLCDGLWPAELCCHLLFLILLLLLCFLWNLMLCDILFPMQSAVCYGRLHPNILYYTVMYQMVSCHLFYFTLRRNRNLFY